jgi:hypothetical protein
VGEAHAVPTQEETGAGTRDVFPIKAGENGESGRGGGLGAAMRWKGEGGVARAQGGFQLTEAGDHAGEV